MVQNVILRHGLTRQATFLVDNATDYTARLRDRTGEEFKLSSHFKLEDLKTTNSTFLHHSKGTCTDMISSAFMFLIR